MPISVRKAIDSQTGEKIIIERRTNGQFVDGIYQEGKIKRIKALASVQPTSKEDTELLTGLERTKDVKIFYVNKPVICSDNYEEEEADVLIWKDKRYKAMRPRDWESFGYDLVLGARNG